MLVERQRDGRAVFPEPFERIEKALFFVEHVHDDVAEVEQNPTALSAALAAKRFRPSLDHALFDLRRDGLNVAFVAPRYEQEHVGKRQRPRHVERDQVIPLFRVGSVGRDLGEGNGAFGGGHGVLRRGAGGQSTQNSPFTAASTNRPIATTAITTVVATSMVVTVLLDGPLPVAITPNEPV